MTYKVEARYITGARAGSREAFDRTHADEIVRGGQMKAGNLVRTITVSMARGGTILERWTQVDGAWRRHDEGLGGVREKHG